MVSGISTPHEEKKGFHLSANGGEEYVGNDYESSNDTFSALMAEGMFQAALRAYATAHRCERTDKAHDIQLRTMSWKKATALLFGEQVCL